MFPSTPALLGLLGMFALPTSVILMLPKLVVGESASIVGNPVSNDIFTCAVFCSSQAELRRGVGALFVVGKHPLSLLHHFFLILPAPS